MPRCLMAKKWKAYPWPDRADDVIPEDSIRQQVQQQQQQQQQQTDDEEIDVVGDAGGTIQQLPRTCWGPHSPTAGATAPSPPPLNASGALYYHGKLFFPSATPVIYS